jgi:putative PIN family toxin of toxin-antitoxin system
MKIVLDTNILVSAAIRGGKPFQLLKKGESGEVRIVLSDPIISEFEDVLSEPRIGFDKYEVNTISKKISTFCKIINPKIKLKVITDDPDDDRILECAVSCGADYVVSGDKHLLNLGEYRGIKIITAAEMLNILQAQKI